MLLALVGAGVDELLADVGELDVAALDFGETQHLQRFGDRKQLVDFHVQFVGETGRSALPLKARAASVSSRPDSRLAETRGSIVSIDAGTVRPRAPICGGVGVRAVIAT